MCTRYSINLQLQTYFLQNIRILQHLILRTTPSRVFDNNLRHGKCRVSIDNGLANRSWPTNELFEGIGGRLDDWEKRLKGNEGAPEPVLNSPDEPGVNQRMQKNDN